MELSRLYFIEAVQPILDQHFPGLVYSAGRLDFGSDVLGFDTPMSRDHDWGPRLMLFVAEEELDTRRDDILRCLSKNLPVQIHGYPTHFENFNSDGTHLQLVEQGPVDPYISVISPERFFLGYAGVDITRPLTVADWLVIPWQRLATIRAGHVFHDGLNRFNELKALLHWYPQDVWLYALATGWRHIDQEEPFMGRTADAGDELGSRILTARLLNRLMQLCFLLERRWPPYSKWFGSAFARLDCAAALQPLFLRASESRDWQTRQTALSELYIHICSIHNKTGITAYVAPEITPFYTRPFQVPHAQRYADALYAAIQSEEVLALPRYAGSIDQFVQNIDVLESIPLCRHLRHFYQSPPEAHLPDPCPHVDARHLKEKQP